MTGTAFLLALIVTTFVNAPAHAQRASVSGQGVDTIPCNLDQPCPAGIGGPFRLVDQNGGPFSDKDLKGKPFLVFFGYTHCPDICPTALFEMSEIMRALGSDADRTAALFITVDPERDTSATLKDYLSSFDPHIRGLTGDLAAVAAAAKAYRVYYQKVPFGPAGDYTMDHSAIVYLMDKDGRFISPFNMKRTADVAAADLRKYF
jgi:protein SCO1